MDAVSTGSTDSVRLRTLEKDSQVDSSQSKVISAKAIKNSGYLAGLNKVTEAVISEHYLHRLTQQDDLRLYTDEEFNAKSVLFSEDHFTQRLLPALRSHSATFVQRRVEAARRRVKERAGHLKGRELAVELITEALFDRQFLKGARSNISRPYLRKQITHVLSNDLPLRMVIPALPYKSSSPLKSRGLLPDLGDACFLLSAAELAGVLDQLSKADTQYQPPIPAQFTVVCDGRRFNHFLNEPDERISTYIGMIREWIAALEISTHVQIIDYRAVIEDMLPPAVAAQKSRIRQDAIIKYTNLMMPIFNPRDIITTCADAIARDPDPESENPENRFVPLFKSLIYIINSPQLHAYSARSSETYADVYFRITKSIFTPIATLSVSELAAVSTWMSQEDSPRPEQAHIDEYLRLSMLEETWLAVIDYISEIKSDRDLDIDSVTMMMPNCLRYTIHAKVGQLAFLATTLRDPVQPWHASGVIMRSRGTRVKVYNLPILKLEGDQHRPVLVDPEAPVTHPILKAFQQHNQPLFYVQESIGQGDPAEMLSVIEQGLNRKRKK
jgi:hypothetical protein